MVWKQYLAHELWIHAMFDVACPVVPSGLFADDSDALAEQTATPNGVLLRWFLGVEVVQYRSALQSAIAAQRTAFLHSASRRCFPDIDIDGTNATAASKSGWITEIRNCRREADVSWRMVRRRTPICDRSVCEEHRCGLTKSDFHQQLLRGVQLETPFWLVNCSSTLKVWEHWLEKELAIIIDPVFFLWYCQTLFFQ